MPVPPLRKKKTRANGFCKTTHRDSERATEGAGDRPEAKPRGTLGQSGTWVDHCILDRKQNKRVKVGKSHATKGQTKKSKRVVKNKRNVLRPFFGGS